MFEEKPVTVLTNVDYEHRERLGWSLASIAREKSALIRGGETVITGARRPEVVPIIEARCLERDARLWRIGREVRATVRCSDAAGSVFDVRTPLATYTGLRLPLEGAHQVSNAALAIAAAQEFSARAGRELTEEQIRQGLASVRISGRLELMSEAPRVLLDSAHNPIEARRLAEALRAHELRPGRGGRRPRLHLVAGILADKDQPLMVRALSDVADRVVVTVPPLEERAGDPQHMLELFARRLGAKNVRFEPSPSKALDVALADASTRDVVCVTGSMFLVGALRERWVPGTSDPAAPERGGMTAKTTATLLITCNDQKGLVAAVSDFLYRNDGNITHADQHTDIERGDLPSARRVGAGRIPRAARGYRGRVRADRGALRHELDAAFLRRGSPRRAAGVEAAALPLRPAGAMASRRAAARRSR